MKIECGVLTEKLQRNRNSATKQKRLEPLGPRRLMCLASDDGYSQTGCRSLFGSSVISTAVAAYVFTMRNALHAGRSSLWPSGSQHWPSPSATAPVGSSIVQLTSSG